MTVSASGRNPAVAKGRFHGQAQGVGFRYVLKKSASIFGLKVLPITELPRREGKAGFLTGRSIFCPIIIRRNESDIRGSAQNGRKYDWAERISAKAMSVDAKLART